MGRPGALAQTALNDHVPYRTEPRMTPTQTISPQTGIVVATAITAGIFGELQQHAEGIVVSTALTAGLADRLATNHAEGIAVSTAITAGLDGLTLNHAEGLVLR